MTRPTEGEAPNSQVYLKGMLDMHQDDPETTDTTENGNSEVTDFYSGLNILVTGGSGFFGKILIEKLLRSCPQIEKLYMLMRAKKGKTIEERFEEHFNDVVYDRLREERPNYMSQVAIIEGDTSLSDLGLSEKDRQSLVDKIHVVFHGAANVRFDEALREVVNTNVRGTKLVLLMAKEMKNLKAFVHISTAYSYCIQKKIEEKFYEPPMDVDKVLNLVEILDNDLLQYITPKVIDKWPNTYTFSKALGEETIRKLSAGMPVCMVRPSIMMATYREPMRAWVNNFFGATGVVIAAMLGLMHSLHCDSEMIADIIPVDYVVNNIIVAGWDTAKNWQEKKQSKNVEDEELKKPEEPIIYNSVSSCQQPITWGRFMHLNEVQGLLEPSFKIIWYYSFRLTRQLWLHNIFCFLFHTVPAVIVDSLARLTGRKPILIEAYKKIHKFSHVISYFCTQQWDFNNDNVLALWKRTNPVDRELFDFHLGSLDWNDYYYHHMRGLRIYILKDPLETLPAAKKKFYRLKIAHYVILTTLSLLAGWMILKLLLFIFSL